VHTIAARTRADNELSLKSTVGGGDRTLTDYWKKKQTLSAAMKKLGFKALA